MQSKQAAVVIPVYKETLDAFELLSLNQCLRVLNNYPIIFIMPNRLNAAFYEAACNNHHIAFNLIRFEDHYFADINGYNQLMLSAGFYKRFLNYTYILIHQLDAFVFKDELTYWCKQGYDFIGAPATPHLNQLNEMQFLKGYGVFIKQFNAVFKTHHQIKNVGNGGFSLRKTKSFYRLLQLLQRKVKQWGTNNEDGFFKYWGNIAYPLFKLPADAVALRFSIEQSPSASLAELHGELPFGCHAFGKYEPETWKRYIDNWPVMQYKKTQIED